MAVSNNLGTLTVDMVLNSGGFTTPLDQIERNTKKKMKEMGMAVDEFGNYTDKAMRKAVEATKALDAQFDKLDANLQREIALYNDTSRAAQLRYDLEKGALQGLSAAQKDSLTEMTRRLSAMESANVAFREQAAEIAKVNAAHQQMFDSMGREIALYGQTTRAAQLRYEFEQGSLTQLDARQQASLLRRAKILDAMDAEAAKSKQLAETTSRLNAQHDQLQETMLAQLATYGQVTRVAKLRYDMERGALQGLTAEQKKSSLQLAEQLDSLDKAAQGSMRGIRGVATGIGYQMQDIAVQLQMGTNPLMVFAQQGSQIASLFGPAGAVAGAVIAIGGAITGALLPSLFSTADAAEEVTDKVADLVSRMDELNESQKKIVATANQYRISDKAKEYDELTKSIEAQRKEVERLNEENGFVRFNTQPMMSGMGSSVTNSGLEDIENAQKIVDANRKLEESLAVQVSLELELKDLRGGSEGQRELDQLSQEIDMLSLKGVALHSLTADQKGYTDGLKEQYIYLSMVKDETEARIKAEEAAVKAAADAAKKAAEDEKNRAESIAKSIQGLEREIALYGVTSRAAQMEYDILKGIVNVKGGLQGIEAQRLLTATKELDVLDAQAKAQEDYVASINNWVKGENEKVAAIDKIIKGLEQQNAELGKSEEAYVAMELAAKGATQEQIAYAVSLVRSNRDLKAQIESTEKMFERLDQVAANVWTDMLTGSRSAWEGMRDLAISTLAEIAHEAYTKPIIMRFQQQFTGSNEGQQSGQAGGAVGAGGIWGAIAVAVVAGVGIYNKKQEEIAEKMTAEYRQAAQSVGTVLGAANQKSDSLNNLIEDLSSTAGDTLSVNNSMLMTLIDIRTGIAGVASGFARTITSPNALTANTGVSSRVNPLLVSGESGMSAIWDKLGVDTPIANFLNAFGGALGSKVTTELFKKSTKIIDRGIGFGATTLADIMATGAIEAFAYAEVQTKKKVFGLTTSNKVKTQTEELDEILIGQFADVFSGAGDALRQAAEVFGLEFDDYLSRLVIDPQKLSLKDLEGEALTKEIESFFSSTLDNWAGVLVSGTKVLTQFQQVGEGAFETVIRLASELNTFNQYADMLDLNFSATGVAAIEASQAIAAAAGGFDKLSTSLGAYYTNFFTDEERAAKQMELLGDALADLGINKVPETREAFRDIIEGLDLTKKADQELFASLIGLSSVFAELVDWSENAAGGLEGVIQALKDAASSAFEVLVKSLDAERSRIEQIVANASTAKGLLDDAIGRERDAVTAAHNARLEELNGLVKAEQEAAKAAAKARQDSIKDQISVVQSSIKNLSSLFDNLNDAIFDIALETDAVTLQRRRAAEFEIETAIRNVRNGNGFPDAGNIGNALGILRNNPTSLYSSIEEMAYATAVTQNKLIELAALTEGQLTAEQKQLALLDRQLEAAQATVDMATKYDEEILKETERYEGQLASLDVMAEEARKQFDKLTGIDTTLLSLEETQKRFSEALLAADFENAQEQFARLDKIESTARAQLDALLGVESGILEVKDALNRFGAAVQLANDRILSEGLANAQSQIAKTNADLLEQFTALREESYNLNQETRKNTQETADILRQMQEESLTP